MKKKVVIFFIPILIYGVIVFSNYSKSNYEILHNDYLEGSFDNKFFIEWEKFWGGNGYDSFSKIYEVNDGYVVFGQTSSTNLEGVDGKWFISRYNQNGDVIHAEGIPRIYDKPKIFQLNDGFLVVPQTRWMIRLLRYNNSELVWEYEFDDDFFKSLLNRDDNSYVDVMYMGVSSVLEDNGEYILTGEMELESNNQAYISKIEQNGEVKWFKIFGGNGDDYFYSVQNLEDGYLVVGTSSSTDIDGLVNSGSKDIIIVKYDKDGNLLWQKSYGGNESDDIEKVFRANDGFVILGKSYSDIFADYNKENKNNLIFKIDFQGNILWINSWGDNKFGYSIYELLLDVDNGYIIIENGDMNDIDGSSFSETIDIIMARFNDEGNLDWFTKLGGNGYDYYNSFLKLPDGFVIVGAIVSTDIEGIELKGSQDAIIAKYDFDGNLLWIKNWGGSYTDNFKKIFYANNKLIVLGSTWSRDIEGLDLSDADIDGYYGKSIIATYDLDGNLLSQQDIPVQVNDISDIFGYEDGLLVFLSGNLDNLPGYPQIFSFGNKKYNTAVVKLTDDEKKQMKLNKKTTYSSYNIGDKITYRGSDYHVIEDSNGKYSYLKLLKDEPLTSQELNVEDNDVIPTFAYASDERYCLTYYVKSSCTRNYDETFIKEIVDSWSQQNFGDDLYEVDGYKARLISLDDMQNLGYEEQNYSYGLVGDKSKEWMNYNDLNYWAMGGYFYKKPASTYENEDLFSWPRDYNPYTYEKMEVDKCAIRPVVNIKKEAIGTQDTYNIGDNITYQDEVYYVIKQVSEDDEYLTLLKYVPLNNLQVNQNWGRNNAVSFYKGDRCNSSASYQCKSGFLTSEINTALEKWAEPFKDDLKSEPILITYSDLSRLGYRTDYSSTHSTYHATEDTPDFVYDPEKAYWMMGELDDSSDKSSVVQYYVLEKPVYETALVRPVIYLDKCALEDGCTVEYTPDPVPDDIIDEPPAPDPDSVPDIEPDDNPQPNPEDEPTTDVTIVDVDNTLKNVSIVSMIVGVVLVIIGFVIIKINHNKELD